MHTIRTLVATAAALALLTSSLAGAASAATASPRSPAALVAEVGEGCVGQIHDNGTGVERIGGADRYEVSAAISASTFPEGARAAYIASGAAFPDALSATTAAGALGGPVLLVQPDSIPPAVADELRRLKPDFIGVVGGPASVSVAVETALKAYTKEVTRFGGADRYEVSMTLLWKTFVAGVDQVYAASGAGFSDALAGAAAAGAVKSPVVLVKKDESPTALKDFTHFHLPQRFAVLGGTDSISNSVVLELAETARTNRLGGADRFEVAAKVSSDMFCPETHTVYIASGTTFPDALSGSATAIKNGGPMLLVTRDGIPAPIAAELRRIGPAHIVILGGRATISDGVAAELQGYLAGA